MSTALSVARAALAILAGKIGLGQGLRLRGSASADRLRLLESQSFQPGIRSCIRQPCIGPRADKAGFHANPQQRAFLAGTPRDHRPVLLYACTLGAATRPALHFRSRARAASLLNQTLVTARFRRPVHASQRKPCLRASPSRETSPAYCMAQRRHPERPPRSAPRLSDIAPDHG